MKTDRLTIRSNSQIQVAFSLLRTQKNRLDHQTLHAALKDVNVRNSVSGSKLISFKIVHALVRESLATTEPSILG